MSECHTEEVTGGAGVEEAGKLPFEIVAAYEDSAARERTVALYRRLEQELGKDCDFKCAWWDLENLRDEQSREQAASEAAEAKMIIVSLRDQEELPTALKEWFEAWAARRRGHKAALVALVAGSDPGGETRGTLQRVLEVLAKRTQLDFFLHWFATRYTSGSVIATKRGEPGPNPASPSPAPRIPFRQPTPRWGINE